MKNTIITEPELLISDAHGIYIGQLFCQGYINAIKNKDELKEDIDICLIGPDHDYYIEAWINVTDNAILVNDFGQEMTVGNLGESGDLWAIPLDYEYPDEF